jgi:hypothetical protein
MSADDDGREIRKEVLPGELAQQVVGDVERYRRGIAASCSPGRPSPGEMTIAFSSVPARNAAAGA